jgi:hypothetical protein
MIPLPVGVRAWLATGNTEYALIMTAKLSLSVDACVSIIRLN